MSNPSENNELKVYAVRLTGEAYRDLETVLERIQSVSGDQFARDWRDGFLETISHLATGPHRPLIPEQEHFHSEIRQVLYRGRNRSAYRVLFTIREETEDGPLVLIVALRHGNAAPLKLYEARNVESDIEEFLP
jgi:hypothetical protein